MGWKTWLKAKKAKFQLLNNNNILHERDDTATEKCTLYTSGILQVCGKSAGARDWTP